MTNKTKIVATIGPASNSRPVLEKMILAGMNIARLNFSHGSYEDHTNNIRLIRSLSREMKQPVGILLDLQGPKIRTGKLKNGEPVLLKRNGKLRITTKNVAGTAEIVSTTYGNLIGDLKKGDTLLLDDGLIELRVLSKAKDTVSCKIIYGGILKEHKGINLPGVNVSAPSLTAKDKRDLNFGIQAGVDYFEILKVTDGIMVARGDLGVELKPEKVPAIQKHIINQAIKANKPVITATQMLETMSENPVPTRAEASDVANAIYDGTDAVMLSGETASGKYPVKAVTMMSRIAMETEKSPFIKYNIRHEKDPENTVAHAVAQSSVNILHEVDAKTIAVFSVSGSTAKLVSKHRPSKPVFAFTPSTDVYNRLALIWGITPLYVPRIKDTRRLIEVAEERMIEKQFIKKDDRIVFITGLALTTGSTNLIKIHTIGLDD